MAVERSREQSLEIPPYTFSVSIRPLHIIEVCFHTLKCHQQQPLSNVLESQ